MKQGLDIANYADDSTFFAFSWEPQEILLTLKNECNKMFQWFQNNYFRSNIHKCHLTL